MITESKDTERLHQLHQQHQQLKTLVSQPGVDQTDLTAIRQQIRGMVPPVAIGRSVSQSNITPSLPQPKTPAGRTRVLHMNYTRNRTGDMTETEMGHLCFLAQTARDLGLRLEILTPVSSCTDVETVLQQHQYTALDYRITVSQQPVSKWAEDSVEYLTNGGMAILTQFHDDLLEWAMTEGRQQRWQDKVAPDLLDEVLQQDHLWIPLGIRVNSSDTGAIRAQIAQDQGQVVGHIRAYIEGGNLITGEDKTGQPVILVGKDAIATTAHIYQLQEHEVRHLICEDFGLSTPEQVVCVEQPGQFHLDMGLLFLGNGVVVLNDSHKALNDAMEMATMVPCTTTITMAAKRKLQYELEETATADLESAGIEVIRQPLANDLIYNFCNGEFVEGKDGDPYYITNGGPKIEEETFERLMVQDWQVVKKVIFSPANLAHKSFQERGGIGCRVKGSSD
ncbi:MAG: hypothetical protein AB4042_20680 [Leptolyngbyaceae cyanobacterium]